MKTAYSYLRFSTPEQQLGDSERRQLDRNRKWCEANNARLDESLNLKDLGVSAFKSKNRTKGDLGRFLKLVEDGKIDQGSLLIFENLDRMSRDEITVALSLLLDIIRSGISVVTSGDWRIFSAESVNRNPTELMFAILEMARGHQESKVKSERIAAAWKNKMSNASKLPVTSRCPGWIRLVGVNYANSRPDFSHARFELIPERAAAMRRAVKMIIEGIAPSRIVKIYNLENVAKISTKKNPKPWEISSLQRIITSRTLVGEYQPVGMEPIKGYYPAVISEKDFQRMQAIMSTRKLKTHRGRTGNQVANLFGRTLVSGTDGSNMILSQKRKGESRLIPASFLKGLGPYKSFPYPAFEKFFLVWVSELDLSDKPTTTFNPDIESLKGQIADVNGRLAKLTASLQSSGDFDAGLDLLRTMEASKKALQSQLEAAKATLAAPSNTKVQLDLQSRLDGFYKLDGDAKMMARQRVRSMIAELVNKIQVWFYGNHLHRICIADVELTSGQHRRFILLRLRLGNIASMGGDSKTLANTADFEKLAARIMVDPVAWATAHNRFAEATKLKA